MSPDFVRILPTSKGASSPSFTASASAIVSAQFGGTVSNGRVTLEFPAGALDQDTEISIEMLNDGTLGVELSPHGTLFNKPVTMSMDLRGTTAEGRSDMTAVYYWNDSTGEYEVQEKISSDDENLDKSLLHHFSRFHDGMGG
jgi:hypothetical protein